MGLPRFLKKEFKKSGMDDFLSLFLQIKRVLDEERFEEFRFKRLYKVLELVKEGRVSEYHLYKSLFIFFAKFQFLFDGINKKRSFRLMEKGGGYKDANSDIITTTHDGQEHVYFLANKDKTIVKIGYSKNIIKRKKQIENTVSFETELIGLIRNGGKDTEKYYHKLLNESRIGKTEWFKMDRKVYETIKKVRLNL